MSNADKYEQKACEHMNLRAHTRNEARSRDIFGLLGVFHVISKQHISLKLKLLTGLDILYDPTNLIQRVSASVTPPDFSELQFQSFRRFTITGERHILFRRFLILHEVL
jgi:hypothetical protein